MADPYQSDRARIARTLMQNQPHEPTAEQMNPSDWPTWIMQQIGGGILTGGAGAAIRGVAGAGRAAAPRSFEQLSVQNMKPEYPLRGGPFGGYEAGRQRVLAGQQRPEVAPEITMDMIRMLTGGAKR